MPGATRPFANYCCELLAPLGPCRVRAMFGGFGLSIDGLTFAIVANLGEGERLWLKAGVAQQGRFEAAGCQRFTYPVNGVAKSMGYYSVPDEAMDSPDLMAPWARLALESALNSCQAQAPKRGRATKPIAKRAAPQASRAAAAPVAPRAARKSPKA